MSRPIAAEAFVAIFPLCVAVFPWGILTGAMAIQAGFSPLQAQVMSLLVFAGAAQLSSITLLNQASIVGIFVSTFVISSRHLLYSMVMRQHIVGLSLPWRLSLGFLLTDESFAVSEVHTRKNGAFSAAFALFAGLSFYVFWNIATLIGIVIGELSLDLEHLGFDFAIVATFIAMTFEAIRKLPVLVAVLVSGLSALLLQPHFQDAYIVMASLLGMLAAFAVDKRPIDERAAVQETL